MKKILFVTIHFPPNQSVGTQRIIKFIKYLKKNEWKIFVITLKEEYFTQQLVNWEYLTCPGIQVFRTNKYDIFQFWSVIKRFLKGIEKEEQINFEKNKQSLLYLISRNKNLSYKSRSSILFRFKENITNLLQYPDKENGWIFPVFFKTLKVIKKFNIPIVFVSSPPHSSYFALNLLKLFISFKYVVDFRDPWAQSQWEKEFHEYHERIAHFLDERLEEQTIRRADFVLFNTKHLRNQYLRVYQNYGLKKKSRVITNGFDPELVPNKMSLLYKHMNLSNDEITIIHTGTLYKKRTPNVILETFFDFYQKFPEKAKKIKLIFMGNIDKELLFITRYVHELDLGKNVLFYSNRTYEEALIEMRKADWLLILQPGTKIQIPAKFFDYLLI